MPTGNSKPFSMILNFVLLCLFYASHVTSKGHDYKMTALEIEHGLKTKDPDTNRNVSQLISSKGYPVEEHHVVTSDGYILGIQRIPGGKGAKIEEVEIKLLGESNEMSPTFLKPTSPPRDKNKVILLHHGLLNSAADWVINFENQSLGYVLADAGYDVWLANCRGNTYSRKHKTLDPSDKAFWQFSWDEIGLYDLPATIDYILGKTGVDKIHYVGHSMGTSVIFALLSEKLEYNDKISSVMALAPVATISHMNSPVRALVPISSEIEFVLKVFGEYEFLPNSRLMRFLSTILCGHKPFRALCTNAIFLIAGPESSQLNTTRLEVITHHAPAGASTYTVVHYAQMVKSKTFQKFDYGQNGNLKKYGQKTPPLYPIEKITAPIALFWSENDELADPKDTLLLKSRIKNLVNFYKVPFKKWSHLDYVYGVDAKTYVHDHLLKLLKNFH